LVVFITVQNLVGIDTVVLIICMFFNFTTERLFTPPKLAVLGDLTPKWGGITTDRIRIYVRSTVMRSNSNSMSAMDKQNYDSIYSDCIQSTLQ